MPAGHERRDPPRRRFDHAHPIRQPVGAVEPTSAGAFTRPGLRIRPGVATLLAFGLIAMLALALQPSAGLPGAAAGAQPSGPAVATKAPVQPVGAGAPSVAPPGDPGNGAGPSPDNRATPGPDPLPSPLLSGYQWPIRNARITNTYGLGRSGSFVVDGQSFHDGLDITSFCGAPITAAHDGVVLGAGRRTEGLLGWVGDLSPFRAKVEEEDRWGRQAITVVIDDGNGYRSVYAHLARTPVDPGQVVKAGELIGYEGASGNATGCHLHYALFNPAEQATLALDPKISRKTKLPPLEIARINPLLVLPPPSVARITWGWGAR